MTEEKKKNKRWLLVFLISILIILPIYFVVDAYNSFVNSNKISETKDSYSDTIEIIKTEIEKCASGEAKFMASNEDCPVTGAKIVNGLLVMFQDYPKNPFDDFKKAIRNSDSNNDDKDLGYISVSTTESKVIVKTCIKTPCKKEENRLQDSIGIE